VCSEKESISFGVCDDAVNVGERLISVAVARGRGGGCAAGEGEQSSCAQSDQVH